MSASLFSLVLCLLLRFSIVLVLVVILFVKFRRNRVRISVFRISEVPLYIATLDMVIIFQALSLYPICTECYKYKYIIIDQKKTVRNIDNI